MVSKKVNGAHIGHMKTFIQSILEKSDFYKKKISAEIASDFQESGNLSLLPFTTKAELLKDQEVHPPFGSNLCTSMTRIRRIHKTSGTTNRPLILALTEKDIEETVKVGAKCFSSAGLTSSDLVVHCLNYNMWAGGYTDHQSLEATGAAVIPFGVGNSHLLIETILLLNPTTIHSTPSYLKKLELLLQSDFNLRPMDLGLKLGLFGAESGLQNPEFRRKIEETWGLKAMNANYGLSDVLSMFGAECTYQKGLHFMGEGVIHPELINIETLENVEFEDGAVGELVITNLKKEAQPLIRYRTNDVVRVLSKDPCECGGTGFRFEIVGRSDDMINVKGLNVFISSIDQILNRYLYGLNGVYQILVNKSDPVDQMIIKAELCSSSAAEEIHIKVIQEIKNKIYITPVLELLNEGALPRTDGKTKRLLRIL